MLNVVGFFIMLIFGVVALVCTLICIAGLMISCSYKDYMNKKEDDDDPFDWMDPSEHL